MTEKFDLNTWLKTYRDAFAPAQRAQAEGFKAAVAWRDSGEPIPEGDEARARIAELEAKLRREP